MGDFVAGDSGNNSLVGTAGDDTLNGYGGIDTLAGGDGSDLYVTTSTATVIIEASGLLAGASDLVQFTGLVGDTFVLSDNVEQLTLVGAAATNGTGNIANNVLTGNDGNNILSGLAGNDTLVGSTGDTLIGGDGNDVYVITYGVGSIVEAAGAAAGTADEVRFASNNQPGLSYTLADNVENLTLTGNSGVNATGNSLANLMLGSSGNDTLNGLGGIDTLSGGAGHDVYYVDNTKDVLIENPDSGIDLVYFFDESMNSSYTLPDNFERLILQRGSYQGNGNAADNYILGNEGANVLSGLGGNDTLVAGGIGYDTLIGGDGNDSYVFSDSAIPVIESSGATAGTSDAVYFQTDTYQTVNHMPQARSYQLPDNVENLFLSGKVDVNGIGNALDNFMQGNSQNNALYGNGGVDTMVGGAGDDTYGVDSLRDVVVEFANGGYDTVSFVGADGDTYVIQPEIERVRLNGSSATNATGDSRDNDLEGNPGQNVLDGGAGNDTLYGGGDADTLIGGSGDDVYQADSLDVIIETGDDSGDSVTLWGTAGQTYVLPDNIENLYLRDDQTAANLTGNAADNIIEGNSVANILNGGLGADTLIGHDGNDVYIFDYTLDGMLDAVIEETGATAGTADEIRFTGHSGDTYFMASNVEILTLLGTQNVNGTGTEINNTINGNSGANILDGAGGVDTLAGGGGNDVYVVDTTTDVIRELSNGGKDEVDFIGASGQTLTLAANVEILRLLGTTATNGTGNTTANTLLGNGAANVLKGGDGVDIIVGSGGADTLCGNTNSKTDDRDSDHFVYFSTDDSGTTASTRDTIWGYFNGKSQTADKIDLSAVVTGSALDHFTFIGSAAFATARPGEVRVIKSGADYIVQVNTDADSDAEMTILVHPNSHTFVAADFIL